MKKITIENLRADDAYNDGISFVKAALDAGLDPALETIRQGQFSYFRWLVVEGYDLKHLRTPNFTWDDRGRIRSTLGDDGVSISGDYGTSMSGEAGTSISGREGRSISGYRGTSFSGEGGVSDSDEFGKCASGKNGTLIINFNSGKYYRVKVAYVGEDGILPNVLYELDDNGDFVRADRPRDFPILTI